MNFVSIIMGSKSDYEIMKNCSDTFEKFNVKYEMIISSAHRSPERTKDYVKEAEEKGAVAFIAAAGMAAHLCGVIASMTTLPVIGVPINASLDGMDALLAIVQMPPGIPVATVGINGSLNAGILAVQMLAVGDEALQEKLACYKKDLKKKIIQANEDLAKVSYKYKTN